MHYPESPKVRERSRLALWNTKVITCDLLSSNKVIALNQSLMYFKVPVWTVPVWTKIKLLPCRLITLVSQSGS